MNEQISKADYDCIDDQEDEKNCIATYFKPDFSVYVKQTSSASAGGLGISCQASG